MPSFYISDNLFNTMIELNGGPLGQHDKNLTIESGSEVITPFGKLPTGHVIVKLYRRNEPGWSASEVDGVSGDIIRQWTGGLD